MLSLISRLPATGAAQRARSEPRPPALNFKPDQRPGRSSRERLELPRRQKKWAPRSIVFSSRFARARVSLSCKRVLPCSGRRCVCAKVYLVSAGALRHGSALPAWRITPGLFRVARCLCFWGAFGQPAQAEQGTLILCSRQESVRPRLPGILRSVCLIRATVRIRLEFVPG